MLLLISLNLITDSNVTQHLVVEFEPLSLFTSKYWQPIAVTWPNNNWINHYLPFTNFLVIKNLPRFNTSLFQRHHDRKIPLRMIQTDYCVYINEILDTRTAMGLIHRFHFVLIWLSELKNVGTCVIKLMNTNVIISWKCVPVVPSISKRPANPHKRGYEHSFFEGRREEI